MTKKLNDFEFQKNNEVTFLNFSRKIVQLVEQWFPKPKVKGSTPFFPVFFFVACSFRLLKIVFIFFNIFEKSPNTKKMIINNITN